VEDTLTWISDAWNLFKRKPLEWVLFFLVCMVTNILLQKILPFVGSLIVPFIMILLTAGLIYACDRFRREGSFTFGDFFTAFTQHPRPLLMLGLFSLGFLILLLIIMVVFFSGAMLGGVGHLNSASTEMNFEIGMVFVGTLLIFVASFIYIMAMWFAPALVMLHNIEPVEALKMSFFAWRNNILPGIVFLTVMNTLIFISSIPFGLGLLVTIPMLNLCYYISYRSVFFDGNA